MYFGDARGRWDGRTLVVETTNFTDKTPCVVPVSTSGWSSDSPQRHPTSCEWSVTFDDPHTWTRPWTFAMSLTKKDDSQRPCEVRCHEEISVSTRFCAPGGRTTRRHGEAAPLTDDEPRLTSSKVVEGHQSCLHSDTSLQSSQWRHSAFRPAIALSAA